MPTLGSRVKARLAGGPQGRVVLRSTAGILPGIWFLQKTKFQVGTGLGLGSLQNQRLREAAMLHPVTWDLPSPQTGQEFFLHGQRRDTLVVDFLVTFTETKWAVRRQKLEF